MAAKPTSTSLDKLLVIVGPTASGKTALAIALAKKINGEIICADSRTVYKGMDIGTAKPTVLEQAGVPHHLLGLVSPDEPFTVADFKELAEKAIKEISARGKLPILVGGSGLYIDSILYNYSFANSNASKDPVNPRHLISHEPRSNSILRDNTLIIGLDVEPELLKRRIELRITQMFEQGIVAEAKKLAVKYGWDIEAMKTYLPLRGFIEGRESLDDIFLKMVIKDTQLAKKQRTWFKRNNSIHYLSDLSKAVEYTTTFLNKQA